MTTALSSLKVRAEGLNNNWSKLRLFWRRGRLSLEISKELSKSRSMNRTELCRRRSVAKKRCRPLLWPKRKKSRRHKLSWPQEIYNLPSQLHARQNGQGTRKLKLRRAHAKSVNCRLLDRKMRISS